MAEPSHGHSPSPSDQPFGDGTHDKAGCDIARPMCQQDPASQRFFEEIRLFLRG